MALVGPCWPRSRRGAPIGRLGPWRASRARAGPVVVVLSRSVGRLGCRGPSTGPAGDRSRAGPIRRGRTLARALRGAHGAATGDGWGGASANGRSRDATGPVSATVGPVPGLGDGARERTLRGRWSARGDRWRTLPRSKDEPRFRTSVADAMGPVCGLSGPRCVLVQPGRWDTFASTVGATSRSPDHIFWGNAAGAVGLRGFPPKPLRSGRIARTYMYVHMPLWHHHHRSSTTC